jgi:mRNA-degrading endonuclease RelE of RelBE toxin-antitoxin system
MPFRITITADAESHLRALPVRWQRVVEEAIQVRLVHQPITPTKAVKRLRPNPFAEYELRIGDLRVLNNVEEDEVILPLVGRKAGNRLIVGNEEFHGHQDHPPEPPGEDAPGDPE